MIIAMMILMIMMMTMILAITTIIGLQYPMAKDLCTSIVQSLVAAKKPRPPVNFDLLGHKVRSNLVLDNQVGWWWLWIQAWIRIGGGFKPLLFITPILGGNEIQFH